MFLTSRFGLGGSVLNSWRFGARFFEVVTSQTKCRVCQKSHERQVPKSGQIVAKMWAFISPCAFSNAVLQMHALNAWQSPKVLNANWERRRWPPLGGVQSAGHRRCAIGVLNSSQNRFQIHPDLSQMANLKSQALYARQRSYTPLFVSPQEPGDHRSPAQNFRFLCLVGSCWSIFSPSGARLKNDNEKTPKKTRKSRILASQNPPKISPKCL